MIDKKLKYKNIKGQKHMLAYITPGEAKQLEKLGGQKIMTKEGIPAYPPDNDARGQSTGTSTSGTTTSGGDNNYEDQSYSNPSPYGAASKPYDPTTSVDNRLAYNTPTGRFSPMSLSTKTQMGNFRDQMQKTLQPGLPMAIKLGLGTIFPGAGQIAEYFYNKNYDPFGYPTVPITPPPFNDGGDDDDDNQGIINLYQPNMLNVSGEVEDEDETGNKETEDFVQRFKVKDDFRQAKGPERLIQDQAISEMISKLYT